MSEECNGNCEGCNVDCEDRDKTSFLEPLNELSHVKKVIAVMSGKGGVGKSLITSLLAVSMQRKGYNCAILDADITGPSVPKAFGMDNNIEGTPSGWLPAITKTGIKIVSMNLLLEDSAQPVVWRGPVIAGAVKQFWSEVIWQDVDYMFVDMPPGTGDVPLTVFQSIPVDGIIVVTTPQELVSMIVGKAVKMAEMMDIPVIGLVENLAYYTCPHCGEKEYIFGNSDHEKVAKSYKINLSCELGIDPQFAKLCDGGIIELAENGILDEITDGIEKLYK